VGTPPNLPDLLQFCFSSAFVAPLLPPTRPRCSSSIAWFDEPMTLRAARRLGDIIKNVEGGMTIQPEFRFLM